VRQGHVFRESREVTLLWIHGKHELVSQNAAFDETWWMLTISESSDNFSWGKVIFSI
jgi:hypothetical protein